MADPKTVNETRGSHNLILSNRKKVDMTGVVDVDHFNEDYILLSTELGYMEIRGSSLRIVKLDVENKKLTIEGDITALVYDDKSVKKKPKSVWGK
ncbi:MAG: sporulation protein YabP [Clostridiaceae bacterium]|nr:sporulation protein YabP [Clostridiaceae bacterium]